MSAYVPLDLRRMLASCSLFAQVNRFFFPNPFACHLLIDEATFYCADD